MKTSTSTCPKDHFIKCANCARWIKAGSPVVTTVMPGLVTQSHAECPLRPEVDAVVQRIADTARERWAEDHWDYVERIGAE